MSEQNVIENIDTVEQKAEKKTAKQFFKHLGHEIVDFFNPKEDEPLKNRRRACLCCSTSTLSCATWQTNQLLTYRGLFKTQVF